MFIHEGEWKRAVWTQDEIAQISSCLEPLAQTSLLKRKTDYNLVNMWPIQSIMYMCSDCLTSNSHLDKIADSAFVACSLILSWGCASSEKRTECTEDVMKPGSAVSAFRPNWKKKCKIFQLKCKLPYMLFSRLNPGPRSKYQGSNKYRITRPSVKQTHPMLTLINYYWENTRETLQGTHKGEVNCIHFVGEMSTKRIKNL